MLDCTLDSYHAIYAPWLAREDDLLSLTGAKPTDRILDLCGGTGVLAKKAIKLGIRDVTLLDLNPRCSDPRVKQVRGPAEKASTFLTGPFDIICCRQALGYLDLPKVIPEIARLLPLGGRFAFNTFEAPTRWGFKTYQWEGADFLEAHLSLFGRVLHLQSRQGVGVDMSLFRSHTYPQMYRELQHQFTVEIQKKGRSQHWVCQKVRL